MRAPARRSGRSPTARVEHGDRLRLETGQALPSDQLIDAILDAYSVVTGIPRLELLERATAAWQRDEYGEVTGL